MCLVFKLKKILLSVVLVALVSAGVLLVDVTSAAATTPSPAAKTSVTPFPAGVLGVKSAVGSQIASPGLPSAVTYASWPSWDDVTSFLNEAGCDLAPVVGATLSATTGVCDDTLVGSVVEGTLDALDCATDIPLCITNWIYNVVGSGVSWVATGIVTLVTSTREECMPGASSGSGDWASINANCEDRIAKDYFPAGYMQDEKLTDVMSKSYVDQRRDLRAQMRTLRTSGRGNTDEYRNLQAQLALIDGRTDDAALSESLTVEQLRGQNSVFDVPKAAVSSPTWDREYGKYVLIGVMLLVPMIIAACLQALISGKGQIMLRAIIIHMPLAIIGMIVAPWLVRSLMALTDSFSSFIISDVQGDVSGFFTNMTPESQASMGIPLLMGFTLTALIFIFAALLIWFVLSMREASVALIAAFIPVALAASVWPALGKWAVRAIKLLVAAIISKIFIVGAISLGLGTFTGATQGGNISVSHMVFGATIFFIAAFSPHLVMKFFDEIGDALNAAGGTGAMARGLGVMGNANGTAQLMGLKGGGGGGGLGGMSGGGSSSTGGLALASQDGNNAAKDAIGAGATKGDAALSGARSAAQSGASQGLSASEQGRAAGGVYGANSNNGHESMATPGGSEITNSQMAGGLAAASQAEAEGQSDSGIATAAGMGASGAGASPAAAGEFAYGTAMSRGMSHEQASAIGNSVQASVTPAPAPKQPISKLKLAASTIAAGPIGAAAYLAKNR